MHYDDLVTVYSAVNPVEAEAIKNALTSEGVRCALGGTGQAAIGTWAFPIDIQVRAGDADRASNLLRTHKRRQRTYVD